MKKENVMMILLMCSILFAASINIDNENITLSGIYDIVNISNSIVITDNADFNTVFLKENSSFTMNNSNTNNIALYPEYTGNVFLSNSNIGTIMYPENCYGTLYFWAENVCIEDDFITGIWLNGNTFNINTRGDIPPENIRVIPEPITAFLLSLGILGIRKKKEERVNLCYL